MVQIFRKGKYFFAMKKRKLGPVLFSNRSFGNLFLRLSRIFSRTSLIFSRASLIFLATSKTDFVRNTKKEIGYLFEKIGSHDVSKISMNFVFVSSNSKEF